MSTEITYFLNVPTQDKSPQDKTISLTNLGNGQALTFNSLDNAISFLDKSYPLIQDNDSAPHTERKGASG